MTPLALELNGNGISGEAFTFFTALLGLVSLVVTAVIKLIFDNRELKRQAGEASTNASEAAESTHQIAENTKSVSNGFANRMDRKLDTLGTQIDDIAKQLTDHMAWHLNNQAQEKE